MARKKLSPLATILTIGAVGLTGFAVYRFLIKPAMDRKKALNNIPIMDTDFVEVVDPNQA
jgi:hypothetical protein